MTRQENTHKRSLDFSGWIRGNLKNSSNGLIVQDIDWIFVNYFTGYFILVEEKTHRYSGSKHTSPAQTVILKMLNDLLEMASESNKISKKVCNPATNQTYTFKGSFILEFVDGTDPDNSSAIFLNGQSIIKNDLINLLNLEENSIEVINKYNNNWINENLAKQLHILKASRN
jgi:hypothetical protein